MEFSVAQSWLSSFGPAQAIFLILLLTGVKPVQQLMGLAKLENGPSRFAGFSFGWFLYSVHSLLYALGITTSPNAIDSTPSCVVINPGSKHPKHNKSPVLSRLFRDYSTGWINTKAKADLRDVLKNSGRQQAGLCVAIYQATGENSKRFWDTKPTVSLLFSTLTQLTIATTAFFTNLGSLRVLILVAFGTLLSATSGYPFRSKSAPRKQSKKTHNILLTTGQGSQHALLIKGHENSLHLEDLANGLTPTLTLPARVATLLFSLLWLSLFTFLITISARDTWALVAVGLVGWVQNLYVASGKTYAPNELGLGTLVFKEVVVKATVRDALSELVTMGELGSAEALQAVFLPGEKVSVLTPAPLEGVTVGGRH